MRCPRVLVVDDEKDILESLCGDLRLENWDVYEAHDGNHALEILHDQSFDVIVSDLVMPGINGLGLLREVRKKDAAMIFVLMSGYNVVPIWDCFASGATEVLGKPFRMRDLRELIHRMRNPLWERWGLLGQKLCAGKITNHIEMVIDRPDHSLNLGRGGMFVAPGNIGRVTRGDIVSFSIKSPQLLLEGAGKIQWKRHASSGLTAGLGVEFLFLEDSCRRNIIQKVESLTDDAVIPVALRKSGRD